MKSPGRRSLRNDMTVDEMVALLKRHGNWKKSDMTRQVMQTIGTLKKLPGMTEQLLDTFCKRGAGGTALVRETAPGLPYTSERAKDAFAAHIIPRG